jgi:hypothetical protein
VAVLYGHRVQWQLVDGKLEISAVKNPDHIYGGKVVPSGFFDLPGAENVSAILFSNAGTLAKFDRMGIAAGVFPENHKYFRFGVRYNHKPNTVVPTPFFDEIKSEGYEEYWSDELQLFHNPRAKRPLSPDEFDGITQHFFKDGEVYSISPENTVLASQTMIMHLTGTGEEKTVL